MVHTALHPDPVGGTLVSVHWVEGAAGRVLAAMEKRRSTSRSGMSGPRLSGRCGRSSCKPIRVSGWSTCWSATYWRIGRCR
jgi:hypothetical protein